MYLNLEFLFLQILILCNLSHIQFVLLVLDLFC